MASSATCIPVQAGVLAFAVKSGALAVYIRLWAGEETNLEVAVPLLLLFVTGLNVRQDGLAEGSYPPCFLVRI